MFSDTSLYDSYMNHKWWFNPCLWPWHLQIIFPVSGDITVIRSSSPPTARKRPLGDHAQQRKPPKYDFTWTIFEIDRYVAAESNLFINFQIKFSFESFRIWISFVGFTLMSASKGLVDHQTDGHRRETRLRIKQYPFLEVIASRSPAGLNSSDVIGVVPTVHFWSGLHGP